MCIAQVRPVLTRSRHAQPLQQRSQSGKLGSQFRCIRQKARLCKLRFWVVRLMAHLDLKKTLCVQWKLFIKAFSHEQTIMKIRCCLKRLHLNLLEPISMQWAVEWPAHFLINNIVVCQVLIILIFLLSSIASADGAANQSTAEIESALWANSKSIGARF